MTEKHQRAYKYLVQAKSALLNEIAASAGKARMHAPTLANILLCIEKLGLEEQKEAPQRKTRPTKKMTDKEE